jgi:hypothetical protein
MRLGNISIGNRIAITFVIVLAILLALAIYGYMTGAWEAQAQQPRRLVDVPLSKYEKRILELDRAALDAAYQEQIHHLFLTWMKDESDQPRRAATGAKQARSAYERSIDAIEERLKLIGDKP